VALSRGNQLDGAISRAETKAQEIASTPVLLFAYSVPGRDTFETQENYAAVCCAVQNILLAAADESLAAGWSTGGVCTRPERLAELLGADASWSIAALLYVGFPDGMAKPAALQRAGPESFTAWLA
jgi:nitroreductase